MAACAVASVPPRTIVEAAAMIVLRIGCLPLVVRWTIGTSASASTLTQAHAPEKPDPGARAVDAARRPARLRQAKPRLKHAKKSE